MYPHRWILGLCGFFAAWWCYDGWFNAARAQYQIADRLGAAVWAIPAAAAALRWYREAPQDRTRSESAEPGEIRLPGWNWAALLLCPLWSAANRVYLGLLSLVPYAGWLIAAVVAYRGNRWAWERNAWRDPEHFRAVQREWLWWSLAVYLAFSLAVALFAIFPPAG